MFSRTSGVDFSDVDALGRHDNNRNALLSTEKFQQEY